MPGRGVLQDRAREVLERERRPRPGSPVAPIGGLASTARARSRWRGRRRLDLVASLGLGAERGDPHRQAEVGGAAALGRKRRESRWSLSASTTTFRSSPASKRASARPRTAGNPGAPGRGARRGAGGRQSPREGDQVCRARLGQAVAAGAWRPAPVAIRRQRSPRTRPRVRAEPDAAGLEQPQCGRSAAGRPRRRRSRRGVFVGAGRLVDAQTTAKERWAPRRRRQVPRRRAPRGARRRRRRADDRGRLQVELGVRDGEAAQGTITSICPRRSRVDLVDREPRGARHRARSRSPIHSRQRKATPAISARCERPRGSRIPICSR